MFKGFNVKIQAPTVVGLGATYEIEEPKKTIWK